MPSYTQPQTLIYQQFEASPTEVTDPLRPLIFGPEFKLHRFGQATEEALAAAYDKDLGNDLAWLADLGRQAGGSVDLDYTKVYLKDAMLKYWESEANPHSSSYSAPDTSVCSNPVGENNKVRVADVNLRDAEDYPLDADFLGRQVALGDYARVTANVGGVNYTTTGRIIGFEADAVVASVDSSPAVDTDNKDAQGSAGPAATCTSGTTAIAASGTYDGLADGVITETYTVTVRRGTTAGVPSTMVLDIVSASGKDTVYGYVPETTDLTEAIPLGGNGLSITLTPADTDVIAGEVFEVTVSQAFVVPGVTAAGTYDGTRDATYVVTVTKGGDSTDPTNYPTITVTTTNGYDTGGTRTVNVANGTAIPIGTHGVTITFDADLLCAGDRWYIDATAAGDGPIRTVVLNTALESEMLSTVGETIDLTMELFIRKDLELKPTLNAVPCVNWEQDATNLTIYGGARAFDASWDSGNTSLPVDSGSIYVHWRELVVEHADAIYSLTSAADILAEFDTPNDPDNPLVYALNKAALNSGGAGLRAMAVPTNDLAGYQEVLAKAEVRDDVYALCPLTFDTAVLQAVAGHVDAMSQPETAHWRIAMVCSEETNPKSIVIVDSEGDQSVATVNITTGYLDASVDCNFSTLVESGDTVRISFGTDDDGNETYESYTVDAVQSDTRLSLTTLPTANINVATRFEVWRTLTPSEVVEDIGAKAAAFGDRRVFNIFPSTAPSGGVDVPGYFLAAALAGLVAGSAPQASLTHVQVTGFDNMNTVADRFNREQLNRLAGYGVWIVTEDTQSGAIHSRHSVSTDPTDVNTRELSVTKNVDSISYLLADRVSSYIGRVNVSDDTAEILSGQLKSIIAYLSSASSIPGLGPQVLDVGDVTIERSPVAADRMVVTIDLVLPYPLNVLQINLLI
jgi:hypothetical protein